VLQKNSEEVAECLQRAAEAEARAGTTEDRESKAAFLRIADSWRTLAYSYDFEGSLERFISFNDKRQRALPFIPPAGSPTVSSAEPADAALAAELSSRNDAETVLHNTPFLLTRVSADLRYLFVSEACARMLGHQPEDLVGKKIAEVIGESAFQTILPHVNAVLAGQHVEYEAEVPYKDIGPRLMRISYVPDKDQFDCVRGWIASIIDITEQKRNQEQIVTLAREAEHRSKNLLANVQAIVKLSRADTPEDLKEAIEGRIQALANVNSLFVGARSNDAELSAIAIQGLAPYSGTEKTRIRIDGPKISLEPNMALAIAATLHELATNAAKYGALSVASGRVILKWSYEPNRELHLHWAEGGGPAVEEPTRIGVGRRIIEQLIAQQNGKTRFDWREGGLVCDITVQP
jgi:PAS domain S-box-containing protein